MPNSNQDHHHHPLLQQVETFAEVAGHQIQLSQSPQNVINLQIKLKNQHNLILKRDSEKLAWVCPVLSSYETNMIRETYLGDLIEAAGLI